MSNGKEIEIPVSWGKIAGKSWGNPTDPMVLLFHGLQDNANTFNALIPQLPLDYYYVSVDLPGHGKSDYFPSKGIPLHAADYVYALKLVTDHFDRGKYILIGHSFGAVLSAQLWIAYPERVDKLFIIDTLWFELVPPAKYGQWLRNKYDEHARIQGQMRRNAEATFTYGQALDIMGNWRYANCELTPKAAETLLERSIRAVSSSSSSGQGGGKFKFTRDPNVRNYMGMPVDGRYAKAVLDSIADVKCKIVVIMTKYYENWYRENFPEVIDGYKRIADWITIEGNHHVHLNEPRIVADIINQYLDDTFPI